MPFGLHFQEIWWMGRFSSQTRVPKFHKLGVFGTRGVKKHWISATLMLFKGSWNIDGWKNVWKISKRWLKKVWQVHSCTENWNLVCHFNTKDVHNEVSYVSNLVFALDYYIFYFSAATYKLLYIVNIDGSLGKVNQNSCWHAIIDPTE